MTLVCLIGRHGAGKSSIGEQLSQAGYKHIALGLLRRLARAHEYPSDIPYALMAAMRRSRPGDPMSDETATQVLRFAAQFERCVLDGFPATTDHLGLLPIATVVGVVTAPQILRHSRLLSRSDMTKRAWVAGRTSERELSLASVIRGARRHLPTVHLPNTGALSVSSDRLLRFVAELEHTA